MSQGLGGEFKIGYNGLSEGHFLGENSFVHACTATPICYGKPNNLLNAARAVEVAMYTHAQRRGDPEVQELRRLAGTWLRDLRESRGLSQRELAQKVGAEYYTFISQLETGRGRVPPDRYAEWAAALGVNSRDFVQRLLGFYDPVTYKFLFPEDVNS